MKRRADAFFDRLFDTLVARLGLRPTLILLKTCMALFVIMGCASVYSLWMRPSGRVWLVPVVMVWIFLYHSSQKAAAVPESKEQREAVAGGVPGWGKVVLGLFLPKKISEPVLGDLEEEYRKKRADLGKGRASRWYAGQILMSLLPVLRTWGCGIGKCAITALLEELFRRIAH